MNDKLNFTIYGSSRQDLKNQAEEVIRKYFRMARHAPVEQQVVWSMEVNPHVRGDDRILSWQGDVQASERETKTFRGI